MRLTVVEALFYNAGSNILSIGQPDLVAKSLKFLPLFELRSPVLGIH